MKGLEALEDLVERHYLDKEGQEENDIIEQELKDYYALKKECEEAKWYQEHKALEIIKNKECIFKGLQDVSQEEYDLLKEVLL